MPKPKWQDWEEEIQHRLGLSATICSGNQFQDPGDATDKDVNIPHKLLVDCKYTENKSFSLKSDTLKQWGMIGMLRGKIAIHAIRFQNDLDNDWVVLSLNDFEELLEQARMYAAAEGV